MSSYVLTISIPKDSEWILEELDKLKGSRSAHVVQAIKDYLAACGTEGPTDTPKPPYSFVPGKDYSSTLSLKERLGLVQFGYTDKEIERD